MKHLGYIAAAGVAVVAFIKRDDIMAFFRPTPPLKDVNVSRRARIRVAPRPMPQAAPRAPAKAPDVSDKIHDVADIVDSGENLAAQIGKFKGGFNL
jgi:hypothetical protein